MLQDPQGTCPIPKDELYVVQIATRHHTDLGSLTSMASNRGALNRVGYPATVVRVVELPGWDGSPYPLTWLPRILSLPHRTTLGREKGT